MSANDELSWRERAVRRIRSDLYRIPSVPTHLFRDGYEPLDEAARRKLAADVLVDMWDDVVAIINDHGYAVARRLEDGLAKRLKEVRSQLRRFSNECTYYPLQRELIENDAKHMGEDSTLREAMEESPEDMQSRGWSWTYSRSTFHVPHGEQAPPNQKVVRHQVPKEHMFKFVGRTDEDVDESYEPESGALTFSPDMTFGAVAQSARWPEIDITELMRKSRKTVELFEFRSAVVGNVLFRYEATGNSHEITSEEAEEIVETSSVDRHSRSRKNKWERRKKLACRTLLYRDSDGRIVKRPEWKDQLPKALFQEMAEHEPNLTGDEPHKSIRLYFRNNLGDRFPGGGNIDGWFDLAEEWSKDVSDQILKKGKS